MVWFGRNIKDHLFPNQSPPFAAAAFVRDRVRPPMIPKGVHDCIFQLSQTEVLSMPCFLHTDTLTQDSHAQRELWQQYVFWPLRNVKMYMPM